MNSSIWTMTLMGVLAVPIAAVGSPGQLGGEEGAPPWRARILERFDANGDGRLDEAERHAARRARHEHLLKRFDTNGDGRLDEGERDAARQARREHVLKRIDTNGNGVIDPDERAAIREARQMRKQRGQGKRTVPFSGAEKGTVPPGVASRVHYGRGIGHEAARGHQRLQLQGVEGKLLPKRHGRGRHAPLLRHEAPGG